MNRIERIHAATTSPIAWEIRGKGFRGVEGNARRGRLGDEALAAPCGPAEGPFAEYPMAGLVLHINREAIHHGAEIALLRDLYANRAS